MNAESQNTTAASEGARRAALIVATAAVYFVAAKLGFNLAFVAEQVTVVWPPSGIALAALLVLGPEVWPGIALGAFLANITGTSRSGRRSGSRSVTRSKRSSPRACCFASASARLSIACRTSSCSFCARPSAAR